MQHFSSKSLRNMRDKGSDVYVLCLFLYYIGAALPICRDNELKICDDVGRKKVDVQFEKTITIAMKQC